MRSALSSSRRRLDFCFILLILLICICFATSAVVSEGQPPHCDCDNVSVSGSAMDMVHCRKDETNALNHQRLLREMMETVKERAHRLRDDRQSLGDQIMDAVGHLRSVVSEPSSSSGEMAAELQAGLAAYRALVGAGMARLEASYRSQGDAVDRLREMRRRLQLDVDVDGQRRGKKDDDDLRSGLQAEARALEESIDSESMSMLKAQESLRTLHAEISATMDHVLVLVHYYFVAQSYNYSGPGHTIRLD